MPPPKRSAPAFKLLETTLRDGSYAIDFKFTAGDTSLIAAELERVGFDLIEIGHGVGLGASEKGADVAAETDEDYLKAAAGALKRARFGMFCIPGVATLDHVDMAASHGMGFIRVGTDVTRMEDSEPFIVRARKHGMLVYANFMKSYAMEPAQFAKKAALSQKFGADALYVVDSAGGMFPGDVERYFRAVRDVCDVPLGFHAHNNLGLAVGNSLRALELGAAIVDVSLQGMGRSAGNASTELLVAALHKKGIASGIDLLGVLDAGEKYVRPLMTARGLDSVDVVCGYADFHSSFMSVIRKFSSKYRVDPRKLIIEVCREDRTNAAADMVERIAKRLSQEGDEVFTARFELNRYFGDEQNLESRVASEKKPLERP